MKSCMMMAILSLIAFATVMADTTYIHAPQLAPMVSSYKHLKYKFVMSQEVQAAIDEHPDVRADVERWMGTDRGHMLSLLDDDWDAKYQSFISMFPKHKRYPQQTKAILNYEVQIDILLWLYFIDASIQLVDGKFNGIVFFDETINDPRRWYKTLRDPILKQTYEQEKDDDGVSWFTKINLAINKAQAREKKRR
jgi:hypothetical protein